MPEGRGLLAFEQQRLPPTASYVEFYTRSTCFLQARNELAAFRTERDDFKAERANLLLRVRSKV